MSPQEEPKGLARPREGPMTEEIRDRAEDDTEGQKKRLAEDDTEGQKKRLAEDDTEGTRKRPAGVGETEDDVEGQKKR
jgi:hypothetical protein